MRDFPSYYGSYLQWNGSLEQVEGGLRHLYYTEYDESMQVISHMKATENGRIEEKLVLSLAHDAIQVVEAYPQQLP